MGALPGQPDPARQALYQKRAPAASPEEDSGSEDSDDEDEPAFKNEPLRQKSPSGDASEADKMLEMLKGDEPKVPDLSKPQELEPPVG